MRHRFLFVLCAPLVALACSSSSSPASSSDAGGDGSASDASALDAAADSSTDAPIQDAAADASSNGCTEADFAANDHTASADLRVIQAPTTAAPAQFTPHCMRVKVGQTVTWQGDLADHPIDFTMHAQGGFDAGPDASILANIGAPDGAPNEDTVSSPIPGVLEFQCQNHPSVMFGAVEIVP